MKIFTKLKQYKCQISCLYQIDCKFTKKRVCYCNYHGSSLINQQSLDEKEAINRYLKISYSGACKQDVMRSVQNRELVSEKVKRLQDLEDLFYMAPKYDGLVETWKQESETQMREQIIQEQKNMILNGQCYYCQTTHSNKFYEISPVTNYQLIYYLFLFGASYSQFEVLNPAENVVICEDCAVQNHPEVLTSTKNPTQKPEDILEKKKKRQEAQVKRLQTIQAKKMLRQGTQGEQNKTSKGGNEKSTSKQDKDDEASDSDQSETQRECNWEKCKKKNKSDPEDVLICKSCNKSFHAECCDPPLEKAIVSKYDWVCTECKLCIVCEKNTKENELLMCDCCDRPFHMSCLNPPRTDIPEGRWFCKDCEKCPCCGVLLFQNYSREQLKQYSKQQVDNKIICKDCWVYYKQSKYCPLCFKIIEENAEGNFVYCDKCELWLHYECEKKLSSMSLREIQKQKTFCCSKCKHKQEQKKA